MRIKIDPRKASLSKIKDLLLSQPSKDKIQEQPSPPKNSIEGIETK